MKVRNLLSGFLAAIITVLVVVSLADGYAYYDKEAPKVVYTDPQHEAKNVDPQVIGQTGIRIRFGEPVVVSHAAVTVDGLDLGWMLVDSGDPYEALLKKGKKNLPHDAKIDVKYCVQDYAGNQNKGTSSFTTKPDTEPPYLVWSDPKDGDILKLTLRSTVYDLDLEALADGQPVEVKLFFSEPVYCEATLTNLTTGEEYDNITPAPPLDAEVDSFFDVFEEIDLNGPDAPICVCLAITAWDEAKNENEFTITFSVVLRKDDDNEDEE